MATTTNWMPPRSRTCFHFFFPCLPSLLTNSIPIEHRRDLAQMETWKPIDQLRNFKDEPFDNRFDDVRRQQPHPGYATIIAAAQQQSLRDTSHARALARITRQIASDLHLKKGNLLFGKLIIYPLLLGPSSHRQSSGWKAKVKQKRIH
jgi:hypothetical protein